MAKVSIKAGTTSYIARVFIADSSSTIGAGLAGLTSASVASWKIWTARDDDGNAIATGVALSAGTRGTWSSGGFVEKDATNQKGVYEIGIPNAALAAGSKSCLCYLSGATNMAPLVLEIELTAVDNQDAVRFGLTALPNATAGANTGLPVVGTQVPNATAGATNGLPTVDASNQVKSNLTNVNGHAVTDTASGVLDVNAKSLGGTAQTGRDVGASVLLSPGTGTGQLDVNAGVVKANLVQILATALTETAGQLAAAFKKFFNIATPASTMDSLTLVATATNLTNAPTAGDFTAAMKTSLNAATPVATLSGDFSATMKTSLNAATPVASLSGDFTTTMKTSIGTAVAASAVASVTAPVSITGDLSTTMKTSVTTAATAATPSVTVSDKTGFSLSATGSAALTESYSADGATATLPQLLYGIKALLGEFGIAGTTLTTKRLDGTTSAEVYTLNDGTAPTSIARTG